MKYIYQHLGLGDHIVCNGLVRLLTKHYGSIVLFCKTHNYTTVSFMYRDNPNIKVLPLDNDINVLNHITENKIHNDVIKIGHEHLGGLKSMYSFDEAFYRQFNIDFEERWSSFYLMRDSERENELFNKFNVKPGEYIFIHDDNRFHVDENKIKTKLPIIRVNPSLTPVIFDYVSLIENAKEVHNIESSFQFITDSLLLNNNTYVHRYPRNLPRFEIPKYKNVKNIFN
jgi:hypothetical protein